MPARPRSSYLLRQAQLANYRELDKILRVFGLTPSQYMVMGIIDDHPEGIFSAALARRLGVAPQSGYEIIAGLERRGLVRRAEDVAARRVLMACLTPKGAALLEKCERAVERFERRFFSALSPAELTRLRALLARLMHEPLPATGETGTDSEAKALSCLDADEGC
jgi:DNA-binding MarR family transcriptional regulator